MLEKRPAGCLYGSALRKLEVAGFILTEAENMSSHLPRHAHENSYFCHVLQGRYTEHYGRQNITCKPWSLTFRSSAQEHEDWLHEPVRVFVLEISKVWEERLKQDSLTLQGATSCRGTYLPQLSAKLNREFHKMDTAALLAIEGLCLEILAEASRASPAPNERTIPGWLREAREMLLDRFQENVTLAEVAVQVDIHPAYLATTFREKYGVTIGEFVRRLRIEQARSELSKGEQSLAAIALAAGFADQSHFSRTFKRYTGRTPTEYRRETRQFSKAILKTR